MDFYVSVMLNDFERGLEMASKEGFYPEIRITDTEHMLSLSGKDISSMHRLMDCFQARTFVHGPFLGLDIASLNDRIADYSMQCMERGLEITAALGGPIMVVHSNYSPFFSRSGLRDWLGNWAARMPGLLDCAEKLSVRIALENVWEPRPEALMRLMDVLGRDDLYVCLDTGHIAVFSRLPVERWWEVLGNRVIALHLHDNDGLSDDHLTPGAGIFDFDSLAAIIAKQRCFPPSTFEMDVRGAVAGRRYLENLLEVYRRKLS